MGATITPSIQSIINQLSNDYTEIKFVSSNVFSWSNINSTITYIDDDDLWPLLMHELGHYYLKHEDYENAIELLKFERDAWSRALLISKKYDFEIDNQIIEDSLDSYRDWLHTRSKCTECNSIGIEIRKNIYSCVNCRNNWKVNDARKCGIKRYKILK